jgi:galactokinase
MMLLNHQRCLGYRGAIFLFSGHLYLRNPGEDADLISKNHPCSNPSWTAMKSVSSVEDAVVHSGEPFEGRVRGSGGKKVVPVIMPDTPCAVPAESGHVRRLKEAFIEIYGGPEEDVRVFFAPGRVNLIGDHTDYNGGLVLPATISLGIYAAVRYKASPQDPERVFRARSLDAEGELRLRLADLEKGEDCIGMDDIDDPEQREVRVRLAGWQPGEVSVRIAVREQGGVDVRLAGPEHEEAGHGEACLEPAGLDKEHVGTPTSLPARPGSWTAYPEGVAKFLMNEGLPVPGCDLLYLADLPIGAGLSSSAALEIVTAYSLLSGTEVDRVWLAKLCRRVENEFVGVQCGIMDQFAVAMGKSGYAILLDCGSLEVQGGRATLLDCETVEGKEDCATHLDCETLDWPEGRPTLLDCETVEGKEDCATLEWKEGSTVLRDCMTPGWVYVPLNTGEYSFVIMDSRKERSLAASAYNQRRAQCAAALNLIAKHKQISNLCQASLEDVLRHVDDPVLRKRARHVLTENLRTKAAAEFLRQGKVAELGALMVESHRSLRDDYEVTGPELDALVEAALQAKGCIGARMTGAGFGGCVLALVRLDSLEAFNEQVSRVYRERTGLAADFYLCEARDGVGEVT